MYVATGNPNAVPSTGDYGESVLKLNPTLNLLQKFSGSNATADQDLGSGGAMVLPPQKDSGGILRALAIGAGKDQKR